MLKAQYVLKLISEEHVEEHVHVSKPPEPQPNVVPEDLSYIAIPKDKTSSTVALLEATADYDFEDPRRASPILWHKLVGGIA